MDGPNDCYFRHGRNCVILESIDEVVDRHCLDRRVEKMVPRHQMGVEFFEVWLIAEGVAETFENTMVPAHRHRAVVKSKS